MSSEWFKNVPHPIIYNGIKYLIKFFLEIREP